MAKETNSLVPVSVTNLSGLPPEQQRILDSLKTTITVLSGRMAALESEIAKTTRKLAETQLAQDLRKQKKDYATAKRRYYELVQQFNGIFNVATGYDSQRTIHSKWEQIFQEMEEEDALIAAADSARTPALKGRRK